MQRIPVPQHSYVRSFEVTVRIIELSWKSLSKRTENYDLHNFLSRLLDTTPTPPSCTVKLVTSPLEGATRFDRVSMNFRRAPQV